MACKVVPAIKAEHHDFKRLDGVDDEGKHDGRLFGYAIKHEHGLDGKMPRTGTVRGGHKHGKGADTEDEEGLRRIDRRSEVETKEGYVEMQEIATPNSQRPEQVKRQIADITQRDDAGPKIAQNVFSLRKQLKPPHQQPKQNQL